MFGRASAAAAASAPASSIRLEDESLLSMAEVNAKAPVSGTEKCAHGAARCTITRPFASRRSCLSAGELRTLPVSQKVGGTAAIHVHGFGATQHRHELRQFLRVHPHRKPLLAAIHYHQVTETGIQANGRSWMFLQQILVPRKFPQHRAVPNQRENAGAASDGLAQVRLSCQVQPDLVAGL